MTYLEFISLSSKTSFFSFTSRFYLFPAFGPQKSLKTYKLSYFVTNQKSLKAVFHEFYLVHSWILCPIYD